MGYPGLTNAGVMSVPPAPGGFDRLSEQLDMLEKAITALAVRIEPVMQPCAPRAAVAELKSNAPESRLGSTIARVSEIRGHVDSLLSRIES